MHKLAYIAWIFWRGHIRSLLGAAQYNQLFFHCPGWGSGVSGLRVLAAPHSPSLGGNFSQMVNQRVGIWPLHLTVLCSCISSGGNVCVFPHLCHISMQDASWYNLATLFYFFFFLPKFFFFFGPENVSQVKEIRKRDLSAESNFNRDSRQKQPSPSLNEDAACRKS